MRISDLLRRIEDALLILILSAMIALSGFQILARNFWLGGFTWGDPLLRVMVLWIALLGAMAATRSDKHITIDILSRHLSVKGRLVSRILTDTFTALVCGILAFHGARFVYMEYEAEVMAFGAIPSWLCESIIPFGFGVMALRFMLGVVHGILNLSGRAQ